MKKSDKNAIATLCIGVLITLIAILVIYGWFFDIPLLTSYKFIWTPMVLTTAICILLFGLSFISKYVFILNTSILFQRLVGLVVLSIASLSLAATLFNSAFILDLPNLHLSYQIDNEYPGRMAPNTALALIFAAISLTIQSVFPSKYDLLTKRCSQVVFAISGMGLLGYLFNLHFLYAWFGHFKMAFPTAVSIFFIGIGLLLRVEEESRNNQEIQIKRIYYKIVFIISFIALASTLIAFFIMASRTEAILEDKLATVTRDRIFFFDVALTSRSERAVVLSKNNIFIDKLTALSNNRNDAEALATLKRTSNLHLENGFHAIFFLNQDNQQLMGVGDLSPGENQSFNLNEKYGARLIWNQGYVLQNKLPIKDSKNRPLGYMVTEQRMKALDGLRYSLKHDKNDMDMLVCGRVDKSFECFPSNTNDKPFKIPPKIGKQRLSISKAIDFNQSGVIQNIDYRGNRVVAGYGRIPNTNLGMVVKTDVSKIYAPIKAQFYKTSLALLLLIGISLLLIRRRLMPLINFLEASKRESETARQQFEVAAEGGLDGFMILQSVRNLDHSIVDFKCIYVNEVVFHMFKLDKAAFQERSLFSNIPQFADTKFISKFKYVIDTDNTVSEELKVDFDDLDIKWISQQVVKLGDGVAVTLRDISARKQVEAALAESERVKSAIVRSVAYSIIATDTKGTIISMNEASQKMLWYAAEELVGKHTPEIIHDKEEVTLRALELSLELGREIKPGFDVFVAKTNGIINEEREWTYIRKDGSRFPVKLSVTQLKDEDNQICGYLGVAYDITEFKRNEEYIKHIALHDVLTGLPNRTLFTDRAGMAFEHAKRERHKVAIALLDLDHFKHVNDSLGHHIGDILLQEVTKRLQQCLRPTDTVARMGGDEFAFVLPNINDLNAVEAIFNKIIKALKPEVVASNHKLHITASVGICIYPDNGFELSELLRNADTAMYRAKGLGRNNYQLFTHEMEHQATKRLILENEMRTAISSESFELYYQPQFDTRTNKLVGVEALLRWQKEPDVFVSPLEFIPVAEESGLILPLGNWVIGRACIDSASINKHFGRQIRMAINISPRQFSQKNLCEVILSSISSAHLSASQFEIEITENVLMSDIENSELILNQLSQAGVKIALDDFGTGYSSLSYLTKFPIDRIKIDQSFIKNISDNKDGAALAKLIINLSKSLNIPSIAEGVENEEQLEFVRASECDEVQGFYLGVPMQFESLIKKFS